MIKDILFKVKRIKAHGEEIFRLDLKAEEPLGLIKPGQFLNLEVPDRSLILRRPFCVYDYFESEASIYFAICGKGTRALSNIKEGALLKATIPLGNGFDHSHYTSIGLLGGGMGCAALNLLSKEAASSNKNVFTYLGFSTHNRATFLEDFKKYSKVLRVFTADGSVYEKGFALPALKDDLSKLDAVFVCGPHALVKAVKSELRHFNKPVFVSLEQRMACGVGACLVCTCETLENGKARNKRVCFDGPVFNINEIQI